MQLGQRAERRRIQLGLELARQRGDEQPAAHPDPPVDLPHRQADADALECLTPGQDLLVDAVDQGPVEVEQEGAGGRARSSRVHCR